MALFINNRSVVHAASNGVLRTEDCCYTGGDRRVVAYTNIALSKDAANTARTVFHNGYPVCHAQSYFAKSTGDEPGDAGVHSGTIQGKAEFISASEDVFFEGQKAVRDGELMVSNNRNTSVGVLIQ